MKLVVTVIALGLIAMGISAIFAKQQRDFASQYQALDANYKHLEDGYVTINSANEVENTVPANSYIEPSLPQIVWHTWGEGARKAQQLGLPAYIHFTKQANCAPCEHLRRNVYPNERVVEAAGKFVCVEIYLADRPEKETAEGNAALAAFGIDRKQGFPQDMFLWPAWEDKNLGVHKVLGENIPKEPREFVQYLNEWNQYLTGSK